MSTDREQTWKRWAARLARLVGMSPRAVETATAGRVPASEAATLMDAAATEAPPAAVEQPVAEHAGPPPPSPSRAEIANEYVKERMLFVPRMFQALNATAPEAGERYADFYATVWGDGALSRKVKELTFVAIAVAARSPAVLIHVVPAIEAGASDEELFEAVSVGMLAAGFVPGGVGIPYAFQYALKVLEVAQHYRAGEPWEYVQPAEFTM